MKYLLAIVFTVGVLSCNKKQEQTQDPTGGLADTQNATLSVDGEAEDNPWPISVLFYHDFIDVTRDCRPGVWYCWQIGAPTDNRSADSRTTGKQKSFLKINKKKGFITFGIDNREMFEYNSQFMSGSDYNFPQDTLNTDITKIITGSPDKIYVKKGSYHFDVIDSVINVTVPYFIVGK